MNINHRIASCNSRWLLLCIICLVFTIPAHAQYERLTLKLKNVSLLAAMDSIQRHSGYRFSYNLDLVPRLQKNYVSVNVVGEDIYKVLAKLFAGREFNYKVQDNIILLSAPGSPRQEHTSRLVLMQSIKGKVVDKESLAPITNVSVTVVHSPEARGTLTDSNGLFSLKVPVGRQSLQYTMIGYREYLATDIMVISGKENFLTIEMQELSKQMQEVIVHAAARRDQPLNAMTTVSAHRLTTEDASRFAGGYNDPARMVTAFAGVVSGGEGRNNMSIRGNAPSGLLWKLEGVEIPAPNHFSQGRGDAGGIFNIVASDMLSDFDFFTGAFPAEYGNALSGILDLNFRKGNADKAEYAVQLGMIGTQLSMEGPISKNRKSSYLLNYRYGNLQFLSNTGIIDLDENQKPPIFQDFNLHIHLPAGKAGNFSIFGIGGISKTGKYSSKDSIAWTRDPDLRHDETEYHQLGVLGIKHTIMLPGKKTYLKSILSFSSQTNRFDVSELDHNYTYNLVDSNRFRYPVIRLTGTLNHKFNAGSVVRGGFTYSQFFFDVFGRQRTGTRSYYTYLDQHGNTALLEGFFQWKYNLTERLQINSGLHATGFLLNNDFVIEPRFGAKYRTGRNAFFSYGFGLHTRIEPISLYFTKIVAPGGDITQPNLDLQLTRAVHHVLGYELSPVKNLRIKLEAYHQYLSRVPVMDDTSIPYSVINSLYQKPDTAYVNKGKGYNKGIELTLEKLFSDNYYFLLAGALFDSKYAPANGEKYNTYFNSRYMLNGLAGIDIKTGKSKQHIFSINVRGTIHGGFRYSPAIIDTNASGRYRLYFPIEQTYTGKTPAFIRWDAGFRFRKNNRRYSWILSLDVQNITNRENVLSYETHVDRNNNLFLSPNTDLGIIPILNLKVEF